MRRFGPVLLVITVLTGCASLGTRGSGADSGSCALVVTFEGREYAGQGTVVRPVPGDVVGTATLPSCNDTGGQGDGRSGDTFEVARFGNVDPSVAIVSMDGTVIYMDLSLKEMPKHLQRYFAPPRCRPEDEPIELFGTWTGIIGPDEETELDLVPPYDLSVQVREASSPDYERAELTVRVPKSLGTPITHEDVESSLWKGGDIRLVATCLQGPYAAKDGRPARDGYLATEVEVISYEDSAG